MRSSKANHEFFSKLLGHLNIRGVEKRYQNFSDEQGRLLQERRQAEGQERAEVRR